MDNQKYDGYEKNLKKKKKKKFFSFLQINQSYFSRIKNEILKANLRIPLIFIYFSRNFYCFQ